MRKHCICRPAGKKKKKGNSGSRYMTKSQALEHLQITDERFRILCITKGILPRKPKKKFDGYTPYFMYYRVKDIDSLMPPKPLQLSVILEAYFRNERLKREN